MVCYDRDRSLANKQPDSGFGIEMLVKCLTKSVSLSATKPNSTIPKPDNVSLI